MALIRTVRPDQAEGKMKEAFDMFIENLGVIPKPLEMMSASPAIFDQQLQRIHYFTNHPTLSFALLSHIRYLVAHNLSYRFCDDWSRFQFDGTEINDGIRLATFYPILGFSWCGGSRNVPPETKPWLRRGAPAICDASP